MKFEMKNRLKPCAVVSAAIMVIALVMNMMGMGMNLGIDFTGGTLMTYNMDRRADRQDRRGEHAGSDPHQGRGEYRRAA